MKFYLLGLSLILLSSCSSSIESVNNSNAAKLAQKSASSDTPQPAKPDIAEVEVAPSVGKEALPIEKEVKESKSKILGEMYWEDLKTENDWMVAFPQCIYKLDPEITVSDLEPWQNYNVEKVLNEYRTRRWFGAYHGKKVYDNTGYLNITSQTRERLMDKYGYWGDDLPTVPVDPESQGCKMEIGGVSFEILDLKIGVNSLIMPEKSYTKEVVMSIHDPLDRKAFWSVIKSGQAMHKKENIFDRDGELVDTHFCTRFSCLDPMPIGSDTEPGRAAGTFGINPQDNVIVSMESEKAINASEF
uniref:hypothetical protein n=1 Tax=Synechococcus sp. UW106 TaxID=368495 RepID=UPI0010BD99AC|nr:hypothetical protein [Synechococcus sp. UW106]